MVDDTTHVAKPAQPSPAPAAPLPVTVARNGVELLGQNYPVAKPLDLAIDEWFATIFPGSPAAATTEAWNFLQDAKDALKKRLAAI